MDPIETLIHEIERDTRATARWTGRSHLGKHVLAAIRHVRQDHFVPADARDAIRDAVAATTLEVVDLS